MLLNAKNDKLREKYTTHFTKLCEIHMADRDFPLNVDKGISIFTIEPFILEFLKSIRVREKKKSQNKSVLLYF